MIRAGVQIAAHCIGGEWRPRHVGDGRGDRQSGYLRVAWQRGVFSVQRVEGL
jgi:hypothetical protein